MHPWKVIYSMVTTILFSKSLSHGHLEGSAEAFVDRFASTTNGRAACINLVLANEGINSRNVHIQKAESDITKAYWDGDHHN